MKKVTDVMVNPLELRSSYSSMYAKGQSLVPPVSQKCMKNTRFLILQLETFGTPEIFQSIRSANRNSQM